MYWQEARSKAGKDVDPDRRFGIRQRRSRMKQGFERRRKRKSKGGSLAWCHELFRKRGKVDLGLVKLGSSDKREIVVQVGNERRVDGLADLSPSTPRLACVWGVSGSTRERLFTRVIIVDKGCKGTKDNRDIARNPASCWSRCKPTSGPNSNIGGDGSAMSPLRTLGCLQRPAHGA